MPSLGHGESEKKDYKDEGSQYGLGGWPATRVSREQNPKRYWTPGARSRKGRHTRPWHAQTSKAKEEIVTRLPTCLICDDSYHPTTFVNSLASNLQALDSSESARRKRFRKLSMRWATVPGTTKVRDNENFLRHNGFRIRLGK